MSVEKLKRIVKFSPAFHKIHPDPNKNYGVGGVKCFMVLKGKKGAVHFVFGTGMFTEQTYAFWESSHLHKDTNKPDYMGYDVGYHALKAQHKGESGRERCDWLGGKACYGGSSALRSDEFMKIFVELGDEKIWELLESDYKELK